MAVLASKSFALFLPEPRALFLHLPRTGGTWIKNTLINELDIPTQQWDTYRSNKFYHKKHTPLPHFKPEMLKQVRFVFAFVRKPTEVYRSLWSFTKTRAEKRRVILEEPLQGSWRWHQWKALEYPCCWRDDFDEWAIRLCLEYPGFVTRMYERFIGPRCLEYCHFVGRYERLVDDLFLLLQSFGYNIKREQLLTKPTNTSVKKPDMSSETRQLILDSERLAMDRFYGENYSTVWYRDSKEDEVCC